MPTIYSLVPFAAPIVLHAYYPSFADYYPEAELQTKRWFVEHAAFDWIFADVGANVGMYTLLFCRLAPQGHVHAFEPTETTQLLRQNIAASESRNVTVYDVALGAKKGAREDSIYRIWGAVPKKKVYPFTTLDAFMETQKLHRLDCVKIDVDGFDLEVLKGAVQTLRRFNPWLVVEINHALATRGQSVGEALLWLSGQGYTEALVLDYENFVLKRGQSGKSGELNLKFDRDPIVLPAAFEPGRPLPNFFKASPKIHNAASLSDDNVLSVPGPCWSYAASWPAKKSPTTGPLVIEAALEVMSGTVGIGCVTKDMSSYSGKEVTVSAATPIQTVRVYVPDGSKAKHFILRSNESDGYESRVRVHGLRAAHGVPSAVSVAPIMRSSVRHFNLDQVARPAMRSALERRIPILPVSDIGAVFGLSEPYIPEKAIYRYGLKDFNTQVDESGLYRYLYRQFQPRRHLEFGTWEGFGVVLCAESCDAEIWTVNLANGEYDASGAARYSSSSGEISDAGERIGWRYRAAGFGSRVHQLLMDSRDFSAAEFGADFFDSILIDGGHAPEIVASDTDNALTVIRKGGLIIWHDFCPEPETFTSCASVQGVVSAWIAHHDRWRPALDKLFWLRPSWLLIGIRK